MKVSVVAQGLTSEGSLDAALREVALAYQPDRLDVAVAYATKQGIRTLELAMGGLPAQSRWVVGLDDAITQPEALHYLLALPGAALRLVALAPGRRFHPKLYCFWRSDQNATCVSAVGSGNMTLNGLRNNGETAAILSAESANEATSLKAQWEVMWSLGEPADQAVIDAYAARYQLAAKSRKKIIDLGVAPPEAAPEAPVPPAALDGDPRTATCAWLEVGKATGGKELEVPKRLMPFFRVPEGQANVMQTFRFPDGVERDLRLINRKGNAMWRIEFSAEAIAAAIGRPSFYRPDGEKRSEWVIVLERSLAGDVLRLSSIILGSIAFESLRGQSDSVGAARTTVHGPQGRQFGVF